MNDKGGDVMRALHPTCPLSLFIYLPLDLPLAYVMME